MCPPKNQWGQVTGAWQQQRETTLIGTPDLLKRACSFCCTTSTKSPGRVSTPSSPSPSSTCRRPGGDPRASTRWKVLLSLQALPQLSTLHLSLHTPCQDDAALPSRMHNMLISMGWGRARGGGEGSCRGGLRKSVMSRQSCRALLLSLRGEDYIPYNDCDMSLFFL